MSSMIFSVGFNDTLHTCGDSLTYHIFADGGANPAFQPKMQTLYGRYPNVIINGIGGQRASTALPLMDGYMQTNPHGSIMTCAWGTNDAAGLVSVSSYEADMLAIIALVKARGMVPVIPTVPYSPLYSPRIEEYNDVITDTLWNVAGVRQGPDLYSLIANNPAYLDVDQIHFTVAGYTAAVAAWANSLSWVYS